DKRIRTVTFSYSINHNSEEIYSSDEINERFYATESKPQMMKELRSEMRDILKEMVSTIIDNR
ncbi:MAG: hypothetical protein U9P38_05765, partial [Campylobacterota bacterium]|nr:hypothetical protein [Campylobacterota bacterium]